MDLTNFRVWVVTTTSGMHYLAVNLTKDDLKSLAGATQLVKLVIWHDLDQVGDYESGTTLFVQSRAVESLERVTKDNVTYWTKELEK